MPKHMKTPRLFRNGVFSGAPKGIRTPGLSLRRRPLYPAELWAHIRLFNQYIIAYHSAVVKRMRIK